MEILISNKLNDTLKFFLLYDNSIKSYYAEIISENPITVNIPNFNKLLLNTCKGIVFYNLTDSKKDIYNTSIDLNKENDYILNISGVNREYSYLNKLSVDYYGILNLAVVSDSEVVRYVNLVDNVNAKEDTDISSSNKLLLLEDSEINSALLSYISVVDRKVDEILSIVKPQVITEEAVVAKLVNISTEHLIFFTDKVIDDNSVVFIYVSIYDDIGKLVFASLSKCKVISKGLEGSVCLATFTDLSDSVSDRIVKYIFSKDRDNLKRFKSARRTKS